MRGERLCGAESRALCCVLPLLMLWLALQVLCFWDRHKFPLDVLLPSLADALSTFGVAVAKPLLGNILPEYCLGPGDSKGECHCKRVTDDALGLGDSFCVVHLIRHFLI